MNDDHLWVFGYGSLIWNPGFPYDERVVATLPGYVRRFCMRSIHHRGTREQPGLVLALDPDATSQCTGLAFAVPGDAKTDTLQRLRERELVSSAYLERILTVGLVDGRQVEAVVFVVDTAHVQYCGGLPLEQQAGIIAQASGGRGPNTEYLFNTAAHLAELGIKDSELAWLTDHVQMLTK